MPKRPQTKYTKEFIAEFIAKVVANGGNVEGTARQMNIPKISAKRMWYANPVGKVLVNSCNERLADGSVAVLFKILRELKRSLGKIEPDRMRALATLYQTLYDKRHHALANSRLSQPTGEGITLERTERVSFSEHSKDIFSQFMKKSDDFTPKQSSRDDGESTHRNAKSDGEESTELVFKIPKQKEETQTVIDIDDVDREIPEAMQQVAEEPEEPDDDGEEYVDPDDDTRHAKVVRKCRAIRQSARA